MSFSLGNTCSFGLCHKWSWARGKECGRSVELRSGDAILFGGPCRYIHHAVLGVKRGSAPPALSVLGDARLNLTFRDAPAVAGQEQSYEYFEPPKAKARKGQVGKRPQKGSSAAKNKRRTLEAAESCARVPEALRLVETPKDVALTATDS